MKTLKFIGFFLLVVAALSCSKKETVIKYQDRTLVLISDNNEATDLILAIKGAITESYPDVNIHYFQTKTFNVKEASYLLNEAIEDYPKGTYFVGMVEPGNNVERIVFETGGKRVLCPDNGICSWTVKNNPSQNYYFVNDPQDFTKTSGLPFQEFYIYAIKSLLSDKPLSAFGPICASPVVYQIQNPVFENDTTKGEVLFVDNFGNCVTNITPSNLGNAVIGSTLSVLADNNRFQMILGTNYASVPVGDNVCFINGTGRLEMAINYGDLSATYNISAGTKIFLHKEDK